MTMKTLLAACTIAAAVFVGGCDPENKPDTAATDSGTATATPQQRSTANTIVDKLLTGCKYKAALNPILKIVIKSVPGLSTADEIANAVCEAAKASAAEPGGRGVPSVAGVPIEGRFQK